MSDNIHTDQAIEEFRRGNKANLRRLAIEMAHQRGLSPDNEYPPVKAVIFELDGVLVDTSKAANYIVEAMRSHDWRIVTHLIPDFKPYKGVNGLLDWLRIRGIKIGVVTSRPEVHAKKVLEHFSLSKIEDVLVPYHGTQDKYRPHKYKPHPGPLVKAMGILGVKPEEVVSVGNKEGDMIAGLLAATRYTTINNESSSRNEWEKFYRSSSGYLPPMTFRDLRSYLEDSSGGKRCR